MAVLQWDKAGERLYETGVDHGVLYRINGAGEYANGYVWNGLTAVTESPSGAEATPTYADNIKYLNLISLEEFGFTIEAYTYPDEFGACDGTAEPEPGIQIGQQTRQLFGFSYRTLLGNDIENTDYGYKLHLVYNALAAPSEKANATVNDSPEAITFSWEVTTTPIPVEGFKPTASITIDSTKVAPGTLATFEQIIYGTAGVDARLPSPQEVLDHFSGTLTVATPVEPSYNAATDTITIPTVTGVIYKIDGEVVSGDVVITANTVVTAVPAFGYRFPAVTDDDWLITFS